MSFFFILAATFADLASLFFDSLGFFELVLFALGEDSTDVLVSLLFSVLLFTAVDFSLEIFVFSVGFSFLLCFGCDCFVNDVTSLVALLFVSFFGFGFAFGFSDFVVESVVFDSLSVALLFLVSDFGFSDASPDLSSFSVLHLATINQWNFVKIFQKGEKKHYFILDNRLRREQFNWHFIDCGLCRGGESINRYTKHCDHWI